MSARPPRHGDQGREITRPGRRFDRDRAWRDRGDRAGQLFFGASPGGKFAADASAGSRSRAAAQPWPLGWRAGSGMSSGFMGHLCSVNCAVRTGRNRSRKNPVRYRRGLWVRAMSIQSARRLTGTPARGGGSAVIAIDRCRSYRQYRERPRPSRIASLRKGPADTLSSNVPDQLRRRMLPGKWR